MMTGQKNIKQQGVRIPQSQLIDTTSSETGEPGTLIAMADVDWKAVWYYDAQGRKVRDIVAIIGGKVFFAKNGQEWASSLMPATKKFQDQLDERMAARKAALSVSSSETLPSVDSVEVMAASGADDASTSG